MSKFKADRKNRLRDAWALLKSYRTYLGNNSFSSMESLLLFAGYPRSGHTLVGALLDAHPQIILAHQAHALGYFQRGIPKERVFQLLVDNATRFTNSGREWMGYQYRIPGQWQGKFADLKLIGDKSGGITTRKIFTEGDFTSIDRMIENSQVKPVFVHVIRNPYDVITTMTKRSMKRQGKQVLPADLDRKINHFLKHARGVQRLKAHGNYAVIDVYHEDLVADTELTLAAVCRRLGLAAEPNYLSDCAELVWNKPKQSRNTIDLWSADKINRVKDRLEPFTWFRRYNFND